MMEEDFDKRLSDHIKTVFDDTDSNNADAGWDLLREKYPVKNDRKPIAWFWWLAAVIVVSGLGTGVWFGEQQAAKNKAKQIKTVAKPANDSALQHQQKSKHNADRSNNSKLRVTIKTESISTSKKQAATALSKNAPSRKAIGKNNWRQQSNIVQKSKTPATQTNNEPAMLTANKTSGSSTQINLQNDNRTDNLKSQEPTGTKLMMANKLDTASKQEAKKDETTVKPIKADTAKKKMKAVSLSRITYGVFTSAFYSTAAGSDNEFNLGAGGTVDISLGTHLSLSSGLGIMRTTLNYSIPPGANNNLYGSSSSVQVSLPPVLVFNNYAVKLWALDIPLNLKYSFAKPYNFISAGLSSSIYLSEYYDQVYAYSPRSAGLADVHQITQHHFDHADLFKTFNLSFGIGYPVGNKSALIFEPFLKAPFTGLGSQQLKYTLVGINLKLNFQTASK